jgi:NADPH-dependent glutamate synthase beta subunit-like oxidoreductase
MSLFEDNKKHYIAVIGGSISGSEAASLLAESGFRVVVFDMNKLPYGKIEDGLPSWHINLRNRQIDAINAKLNHKNIRFVPNTKIGKDISFLELLNDWGFSAVILANGAWQDRTFPVKGIEKYEDKNFIYQNSLINWFNHKHEPAYSGKDYSINDRVVVVGGGLASLDVIKIVMMEQVKKQLCNSKGINVDLFELEKYGINKVLAKHNVNFEELGLNKAKLVYRRNAKDMPLKSPKDDSKESVEVAKKVSEKLLNKYVEKYLFDFIPNAVPVAFEEENNKLKRLVLQKVTNVNGKLTQVENSDFNINTDLLISSIGSIPEKIEGLQYDYSSLKMREEADYHVFGYDNVFAIGNAVTGKGNIQDSKQHGKKMTEKIIDKHLTDDAFEKWLVNLNNSIKEEVQTQIKGIVEEIQSKEVQPEHIIQGIINKTDEIHKKIGFDNYMNWVKKHIPVRLEELQKNKNECSKSS